MERMNIGEFLYTDLTRTKRHSQRSWDNTVVKITE